MKRTAKQTTNREGDAPASPGLTESTLTPIGELTAALFGLPAPAAVTAPYRMGGFCTPVYGPCTRFTLTESGRALAEAFRAEAAEKGGR